jgi:hypothetical protein
MAGLEAVHQVAGEKVGGDGKSGSAGPSRSASGG